SNDFTVVYHLSQSGFPYADSALQYPATSGVAPVLTNGMIGNGCAFNGTSQFLDAGLVNMGKNFTLSAWVNFATNASSEQTIWANKSGGWNVAGFDFYVNSYQTNDGVIYFDSADGVGGNVSPRTAAHAVSFGQWHLLTGTMDGVNGVAHVYVDGVDQTINTGVDTAFQVTNYVRCGSLLTGTPGATGNLYFNGLMDEPRIENGVRSPAWVWASWATVASSNFSTYACVVPAAVTLHCQPGNGQLVLTWTTGTLQSAPAVSGPYTDISNATSPYPLVPSGIQQFFRVRIPR
ncbi:MAG TPA: LamG domain-containing protein, partial [Verrucomicrobiae bacterium]|nr:LamG domain-containing protein [Verrucomicrobiae bacterium]